jgi:hypothetical protein
MSEATPGRVPSSSASAACAGGFCPNLSIALTWIEAPGVRTSDQLRNAASSAPKTIGRAHPGEPREHRLRPANPQHHRSVREPRSSARGIDNQAIDFDYVRVG